MLILVEEGGLGRVEVGSEDMSVTTLGVTMTSSLSPCHFTTRFPPTLPRTKEYV